MLRELASSFFAAARSIRRRPAFFAVATITLGIALGFATTILGVVDRLNHPPMPFEDPSRTFQLSWWGGGDRVHPGATREEVYAAIQALPAFDAAVREKMKAPMILVGDQNIGDPRFPQLTTTAAVPADFFRVVGVRPRLGRTFAPDEAARGNSVIVSDDIWRKWFQDRASIGNARITLDGQEYAIVGVMPAGMHYPASSTTNAWIPLVPGDTTPWWPFPTVHLRRGVGSAAADAQLAGLGARLMADYHVAANRKYGFKLDSLGRADAPKSGFAMALSAIALCILIISSMNITTLMLARAIARRRDLALRLSLGARGSTLALVQFAEGILLAAGGGGAGLVFALWGIGSVSHFVGGQLNWIATLAPHLSWRFFGISLAASAVVALLTGALPAWQVAHIQPMEPLKESSGGTTGRGVRRVQVLVAGELAISLSLLMATALFARSVLHLGEFQFGFNASHVLSASGNIVYKWNEQILGTDDPVRIILPRIAAMDGVESATTLAIGHPDRSQVFSDQTVGIAPLLAETYVIAGPQFMRTMGIPLMAGRDFEAGDDARGAVILDERAVRRLFPDGKAIGHRVRFGGDASTAPWLEVIGVARRADLELPRYLDDGPRWPPIYSSVGEHNKREWEVVARVSGNAPAAAVRMMRALNTTLPGSAAAGVAPFSAVYDEMMRVNQSVMRAFLAVGIAALALATAGLFAVLSYMVNQRMREFAVRVAIGAQRRHVWQLVIRDAAQMALAGTALGAFGGFAVGTKLVGLYRTPPTDVVALIAAEAILLIVTLSACTVPAIRATRADPVEILRAS
jgi:putative ABC transport system permease protein